MRRTDILKFVKDHIEKIAQELPPHRFAQENAYVNAFIGKLIGTIDLGPGNGTINLSGTIVNSNGPGAAEKKYGADFALDFTSVGIQEPTNKAIIAQAKRGNIDKITSEERNRLQGQCQKMAKYTSHYLCFETPSPGDEVPHVRIGNPNTSGLFKTRVRFDEYLVDHVISCRHGDRRETFIDAISYSNLSKLTVKTDGLTFEPDFEPDNDYDFGPRR